MIRAYRILLRHRLVVLVLLAVSVAGAGLALRERRVLSSMREVFDSDHPVVRAGRDLEERFGEGVLRGVLIAFETPDALAPETLTLVARLTAALEQSPWVNRVYSLATAKDLRLDGDTLGTAQVVDPELARDPKERARMRAAVLANPALVGTVVSRDAGVVALVVKDNFTLAEFPVKNRLYVEDVERVLAAETARSGTRFSVAGVPVLDHTLAAAQRGDQVLLPIALAAVVVLLFATFRNLTDTVVPLALAGATILLVDGAKVLLGFQFNMLSIVLSLVVVVASLCDAVHFAAERRTRIERTGRADVASIMADLFLPSLLTTVTTAAGIGSMVLSDIHVLHELGIAAVIGLGIEFVLFATVVPVVYSYRRSPRTRPAGAERRPALDARLLVRMARLVTKRPGAVLLASSAVSVVLLAGVARIGLEADPYSYLPRQSPVRPALDFLNSRIRGVTDLEILVEGSAPEALVDPAALRSLDRLQRAIERDPAVSKTFSLVEIMKQVNRALHPDARDAFRLPDSAAMVAQYLLLVSMSEAEEQLLRYVDFDYRSARINVNLRVHSIEEIRAIAARIERQLDQHLAPGLSAALSGIPLEIMAVNDELVMSEIESVLLGLFLIGGLLMVAARSVRLGVLGLIPNLVTVVAALGLMGWSGIGLSIGTVMLAPIAIGVAVDDAVHLLTRFRAERAAGADVAEAISRVYAGTGRALLTTTVVLACALGVQAWSSFLPLTYFGLIGLATVALAFLANVLVLPALVTWLEARRGVAPGVVVAGGAGALPRSVEPVR